MKKVLNEKNSEISELKIVNDQLYTLKKQIELQIDEEKKHFLHRLYCQGEGIESLLPAIRLIQGASGASLLWLISLRTLPRIEFMCSAVTLVTLGLVKMVNRKNRPVVVGWRQALTRSILWLSVVLPPTTSRLNMMAELLPPRREHLRIWRECRLVLRSPRSLWSNGK